MYFVHVQNKRLDLGYKSHLRILMAFSPRYVNNHLHTSRPEIMIVMTMMMMMMGKQKFHVSESTEKTPWSGGVSRG